jgi:hypothetical protein
MCTLHIEVSVNSCLTCINCSSVLYKLTYIFVDKDLTSRHTDTINELIETLHNYLCNSTNEPKLSAEGQRVAFDRLVNVLPFFSGKECQHC